jgi:NADPH:quinone reductase-like Zn-dependent oxidoreductase
MDLAGMVEAIGDGVTDLATGQRVWGMLPARAALAPLGSAAELVVVDADRLGSIPDELDDPGAVALLGGGTTSRTALFTHGRLQSGHRVLIRGAAGGVGYVAVQLAHAAGAHVTALARGSVADAVRDLGADVVLDYHAPLPADLGRFDVVLDTAGGSGLGRFRRLVAPGGRMVTIAPTSLAAAAVVLASTIHGSRRVRSFSGNPKRADLTTLSDHVRRGHLRPVIATTWPLAGIVDAHRAMEFGGVVGKHVIVVA